jgi:hypothetical protein
MTFKKSLMLSVALTAGLLAVAEGAQAQAIGGVSPVTGLITPTQQTVGTSLVSGSATGTFTPVSNGTTGTFNGTITQLGTTTAVSCGYDIATGTITGGANCNAILTPANLASLTRAMVSQRLAVAADVSAEANMNLTQGVFERRLANDLFIRVQADAQVNPSSTSPSLGTSVGSYGTAGGGFFDDDRLGLQKDGDSYVLTAGLDKSFGQLVMGGTLGYIKSDVDLQSLNGDLDSKGWLVGGYMGYIFNSVFSVTAGATYVDSNVDVLRTTGATQIASEYDQTEWNAAITANAFQRVGDLGLTGLVGVSYGDWKTDSYTDSTGLAFGEASDDNFTGRVGGVISLLSTEGLTPYASAVYNHYLTDRSFGSDESWFDVSAGLSFGFGGSAVGSLEVSKSLALEDQDNTTVGLHIRFGL